MSKRFIKLISVLAAVLCMFCMFAACSKDGSGDDAVADDSDRLPTPVSLSVNVTVDMFAVSWNSDRSIKRFKFTCNDYTVVTEYRSINLYTAEGFTMPADGVFRISVVSQADGKADSVPAELTYTSEGVNLDSPKIKSFENGVLTWAPCKSADEYNVTVNGEKVTDSEGGKFRGTSLDTKKYSIEGVMRVAIEAVNNTNSFVKNSDVTVVGVPAARTKLVMLPVDKFEVKNGVLKWATVGGASAYKIVGLDRGVIKTTEDNFYDMSDKKLAYCVLPVSSDPLIGDAVTEQADIKYLEGEGTVASPYLIKTPFDLRAIEYYETLYADIADSDTSGAKRNNYRIVNDIDYNTVAALEAESNMYTIAAPFYGTLDGNNKKLTNIRVRYDGGYWAMFDYIVGGGVVKSLMFERADIVNELQKEDVPLDASIAMVANRNYGTIATVTVKDAQFTAAGGEVCAICSHNYGKVAGCVVSGNCEFVQEKTEQLNQGCYEMAGVVVENCKGGTVSGCSVESLIIRGTAAYPAKYDTNGNAVADLDNPYNNVRTAGGIVAVNRAGGVVSDNSFKAVTMVKALNDPKTYEFGGIVAYNAGQVTLGNQSNIGTFIWNERSITQQIGTSTEHLGTVVGKNDGRSN